MSRREYVVGGYWLTKRRDGKAPNVWQIARKHNGSEVYRSTHTSSLDDAKSVIHAFVEKERAKPHTRRRAGSAHEINRGGRGFKPLPKYSWRRTMQSDLKAVAWLYEDTAGNKELILDQNGEYASGLIQNGYTETPLYTSAEPEALEAPQSEVDALKAENARLREALEADNARLKADAARYHWLRDISCPPHNFYVSVPDEFHGVRYSPEDVDAYIDQAHALMETNDAH